ncbi:DUF2147 domain-containing protein [Ulvibacter antarcticus]|uniref:Uncharacterized protein (DUF2147 family) n=1 Tax=Ulvibacter antarcticus TaxID=442714 RepID=A0A3L9YXP7_9FLAO|nr:DUF2147 domain-containing protein [Ulvibacter antarcticus]RMA64607.1 uncharacterized protein (DUF2147 family) [Ulvibacter antarcticus]
MKNIFLFFILSLFAIFSIQAQDVIGTWKTIDDNTGTAKSYVEIFKGDDGKIYGKIIKIFNPDIQEVRCTECKGDDKDQRVIGLTFIRGLEKDGEEYSGGTILNPENGKHYKCLIVLENPNKLKVRGYIGFEILGRTQYWIRVS